MEDFAKGRKKKPGTGALKELTKERRKHTRVLFETQVILKAGNSEIVTQGQTKDISIKGMFVTTDIKIPPQTPCEIELILTGSSTKLSLKMNGKIVFQDSSGLGVVFNTIDHDSYFHLKNLLMYNASDPEALEEEGLALK